jgi:hypothetical protein
MSDWCTKLTRLAWRTHPLTHGLENDDNDCPLRSVTRYACEDMCVASAPC